jgi:triacylglycerol lipase
MYFPAGFNFERSVELGELVNQAYFQFGAFEGERNWKLDGDYSLVKEFTYAWIEKGTHNFDHALARIGLLKASRGARVPFGFAAQKKDSIYLIFRGTQTVKEWMRNFNISLSPYLTSAFGKVHEGFLRTYNSIRREIMESLSGRKHADRLLVAGHSLGAAIATLALPDIEAHASINVESAYTFGSPRVGDDAFVKAFNMRFGKKSFRIANTSDIVTQIPLPAPLVGKIGGYFSHVDTPVDMTVQTNDLEQNHDMETYLSILKENRRGKGFLMKPFARGAGHRHFSGRVASP